MQFLPASWQRKNCSLSGFIKSAKMMRDLSSTSKCWALRKWNFRLKNDLSEHWWVYLSFGDLFLIWSQSTLPFIPWPHFFCMKTLFISYFGTERWFNNFYSGLMLLLAFTSHILNHYLWAFYLLFLDFFVKIFASESPSLHGPSNKTI